MSKVQLTAPPDTWPTLEQVKLPHPAAPAAPAVPAVLAEAADSIPIELKLPGLIGAALADPLADMDKVLGSISKSRTVSTPQMKSLMMAFQRAQRVSRQSQQITRLAEKKLRQSHEKLDLHLVLGKVLSERLAEFKSLGVTLRQQMQPVDIIVDPGLLVELIATAVDWSAERGRRLNVFLTITNWPEHAKLVIRADQHVATPQSDREAPNPNSLTWHLLTQLAITMGVGLDRFIAPDHSLVVLEFARTVRKLEGLTAIDMDAGETSRSAFSQSNPLAGHRVLLVAGVSQLRGQVKDLCAALGLSVESCISSAQAVRACERSRPHVVIIEEALHDQVFDELRADWQRTEGKLPVIELASAPNIVEMSSWMDDSISRISKDALNAHLPNILVMELSNVGYYE